MTTTPKVSAAKMMEWFLMNNCMVVNRQKFDNGDPTYDMTKEFILYISGSTTATEPVPDPPPAATEIATIVSEQIMAPMSLMPPTPLTPNTTPTEKKTIRKKKKTVLTEETQCTVIRKNGVRCMRKRNGKGCGKLCGTHAALFVKSGLPLEEFLVSCTETTRAKKSNATPADASTDASTNHLPSVPSTSRGRAKKSSSGSRVTVTHKGIPYAVDNKGNVFSAKDVVKGIIPPSIIGTYTVDVAGNATVVLTDGLSDGRLSPCAG